jgi:hypothetical protein
VPYSQADCPYPLVFFDDGFSEDNPGASCTLQCPAYVYDGGKDAWAGSVAALYVTSVPSMVCSFIMILSWLLNPSKRHSLGQPPPHSVFFSHFLSCLIGCTHRRYPAILILWLALSAFGVAFFLNIGVLVGGPARTVCSWDDTPVAINMDNAHKNNGQGVVCIMQAIGTYYFGLAVNFWWLASTHSLSLSPYYPLQLTPINSHDQHVPDAVLP